MDDLARSLWDQGTWSSVTLVRLGSDPTQMRTLLERFVIDESTVLHVESHGGGDGVEWWLSGNSVDLSPDAVDRRRRRLGPGLLVVGACYAGTPAGRTTLSLLFRPGTRLLASSSETRAPQVGRVIAPVVEAAHRGASLSAALKQAQARRTDYRVDQAWSLHTLG